MNKYIIIIIVLLIVVGIYFYLSSTKNNVLAGEDYLYEYVKTPVTDVNFIRNFYNDKVKLYIDELKGIEPYDVKDGPYGTQNEDIMERVKYAGHLYFVITILLNYMENIIIENSDINYLKLDSLDDINYIKDSIMNETTDPLYEKVFVTPLKKEYINVYNIIGNYYLTSIADIKTITDPAPNVEINQILHKLMLDSVTTFDNLLY